MLSCKTKNSKTDTYKSQIILDTINSNVLNTKLPYRIYLPEDYQNSVNKFPILYLLHGHGANDKAWFNSEQGNAQFILDSLISTGSIPPIIAVTMHAGNSWYVDSHQKMETAYIKDFMPFIESEYRINSDNNSRIIAGNSAGGFGALRFSLKYPEMFKASILLSPASYEPIPPTISSSRKIDVFTKDGVFNDSVWNTYSYKDLLNKESNSTNYPKFFLSTGDDDPFEIFNVVNDLRNFFNNNNIVVETTVVDGEHSWDVWRDRLIYELIQIYE